MAFNIEKFGFQDRSHDLERSFEDVKERLRSYSSLQIMQIIGKKTFWMWTEGTHQASRYAFGENVEDELQKFQYSTPITRYLLTNTQTVRVIIDSFMKGQYLIILLYLFPLHFIQKKDIPRIYLILLSLVFILYIFGEIKSRYILCLYPFMGIRAYELYRRFKTIKYKTRQKKQNILLYKSKN